MRVKFLLLSFVLVISSLFFTIPAIAADPVLHLQVPIGDKSLQTNNTGYDFSKKDNSLGTDKTLRPLAEYIRWIYKYLIGIAGILATIMMMFGGLRWLTSAGESGGITEAKDIIKSSLVGLVLASGAYLMLATVNPELVNLKASEIPAIAALGCCVGDKTCSAKSASQCTGGTTFLKDGGCQDNKCQIIQAETCGIYDASSKTCGKGCNSGKACESVTLSTPGSKQCHEDVGGADKYWLCSSMTAGGTSCCSTDTECTTKHGTGYVCNKGTRTGACTGSVGVCLLPQGDNMPCDTNADCASPFTCVTIAFPTKRCKNTAGNPAGAQCTGNSDCATGLKCMGASGGLGVCLAGNIGDSCCINSDCLSGRCSNNTTFFTLCTARNYYGDVCK